MASRDGNTVWGNSFEVPDLERADQFPIFIPTEGLDSNFRLRNVSLPIPDLGKLRKTLKSGGFAASANGKALGGNPMVAITDTGGTEIQFISYAPDSGESKYRAKALGNSLSKERQEDSRIGCR